jgi:hypothetical protein
MGGNAQVGLQNVGQSASGIIAPLVNAGIAANAASVGLSSFMRECASLSDIAGSTSGTLNQMANSASGISTASSGSSVSLGQFVLMLTKMCDATNNVTKVTGAAISVLLRLSNESLSTAGTGAAGMAAGLSKIPPQALEVIAVIALLAAAIYGLYRFFKTDDGAAMWRRMKDSAMQCRAAIEPFIQGLRTAVSHLAGTVRGTLGKAWQENRGWILMLADAWTKLNIAQWTVAIAYVSTELTILAKVMDWVIDKLGKLTSLIMKFNPNIAISRAIANAYWKNSGGLPSGRVGGLTTVSTKTPSKKPDGKNENAAIFTAIQKGESVENHKTSTPKHTSTGGIPTSIYRVPSSTAPQYKTPPPTADEKAEQRMGQWETAINAKKAGVALPKDSSWMAGFDVTQWISKLSKIAGGIGEFAKTSVATRLKAKGEIDRINKEAADEYNQSLEKQASALDEQHARGILSDKEYFEKYAALLIEATNNTKASAQTKNTLTDKATSIRISQLDAEYKAGKITRKST